MRSAPATELSEVIRVSNGFERLGPKDFFTGCLAVIAALLVVPILVLVFKVSIYLAVVIGLILALILGTALLGKVIRMIFFRSGSADKNGPNNKLD